jgi:ketosteroid isomerase-like protein
MTKKDQVRKASRQFYAALTGMAHGDAGSMADIWSHGAAVTAMHPIPGRDVGWTAVRRSFEKVAAMASDGTVGIKNQLIQVSGDVACEVGVEHGQFKMAGQPVRLEHRVTNIYQRTAGGWKMIHHHADPSPAMLRVLNRK